jgi:hypothetical protein
LDEWATLLRGAKADADKITTIANANADTTVLPMNSCPDIFDIEFCIRPIGKTRRAHVDYSSFPSNARDGRIREPRPCN